MHTPYTVESYLGMQELSLLKEVFNNIYDYICVFVYASLRPSLEMLNLIYLIN